MIDFKAYNKRNLILQQQSWQLGLYFKQALQSSVLVCGLADKQIVKQMPKYPDMPKSDDEIEKEENIEKQRQLWIAKLNRWQKINNSKNRA